LSGFDQPVIPLHYTSESVLAHPRLSTARAIYVRGILELYENDAFLNRLLIETGRSLVFMNILCLHAAYEESARATWPTMRLLKDRMLQYGGISSPRRIEELVARLVATGYIESRIAPSDRRARVLVPSEKMIAHDLDWLAVHYKPLEVMFPQPGYAAPIRRDPDYQKAHRLVANRMVGYAAKLISDNGPMAFFMSREAGTMILMKLMDLAEAEPDATVRHVSFSDIGRRFGISRTHVRKTLQEAERAVLVQISGTSIALMPPVLSAFDRFLADTMAGHDLMHRLVHNLDGCR
jgi:hypothetical protein